MVSKQTSSITQNKFFSYNHKSLCTGCVECVKGRKTVLYITGICPRHCFYCPLSEQKKDLDVIFANERKVTKISEIINECELSESSGVGITGGDPLARLERTIKTIKSLKSHFGTKFHIHLYTSLDLLTAPVLRKLVSAGLDEIRVHPDLDDDSLWEKLSLLSVLKIKKGIEIPAIPKKMSAIKSLIQFSIPYIDFFNLNEFEYSDTNQEALHKLGYACKNQDTYAIKGSHELAKKLISWSKVVFPKLPFHYCTAKLKDATQIANRLKIRSKHIRLPLDLIDDEGLLIRGVIHSSDRRNIKSLMKNYEIPPTLINYDSVRSQILIAPWVLEEIFEDIPFKCSIVTEYPTDDRMIVESIPLN